MSYTVERFREKAKKRLGDAYDSLEQLVFLVDPDDDPENVRDDWVFEKLCALKTDLENTLVAIDETDPDPDPDDDE